MKREHVDELLERSGVDLGSRTVLAPTWYEVWEYLGEDTKGQPQYRITRERYEEEIEQDRKNVETVY